MEGQRVIKCQIKRIRVRQELRTTLVKGACRNCGVLKGRVFSMNLWKIPSGSLGYVFVLKALCRSVMAPILRPQKQYKKTTLKNMYVYCENKIKPTHNHM